jgi:hypothetical protein
VATVITPNGTTFDLPSVPGIAPDLAELQEAVGGIIEEIYAQDGCVMCIDEAGQKSHLEPNPKATAWVRENAPGFALDDSILGTVVVLSAEEAQALVADNADEADEEADQRIRDMDDPQDWIGYAPGAPTYLRFAADLETPDCPVCGYNMGNDGRGPVHASGVVWSCTHCGNSFAA